MPRTTVDGVIATTHQIDAYGGWRLDQSALEQMRQEVLSGKSVWRANHDATKPLDVKVVSAEVRQRSDSEYELYVVLDADADDWARGGDLHGFSYTVLATFEMPDPESDAPAATLFADAAGYSDEDIEEAGKELRRAFNLRAGRLYQFAHDPTPLILVQIPWSVASQIAIGTVGSLIAAAITKLASSRRVKTPSIIDFTVTDGERTVTAHVESASERTIRKAIEKLPEIDMEARYFEFDSHVEEWRAARPRTSDQGESDKEHWAGSPEGTVEV